MKEIDVEDLLVWAYQRQCVLVFASPNHALDYGGCSWGSIENFGTFGGRVDGGGLSSNRVHIDAELVHEAIGDVAQVNADAARLLVNHGVAGTRPNDTLDMRTKIVPVTYESGRKAGRAVPIWDDGGHKVGHKVRVVNSPESIEFARSIYSTWHAGLGLFAWIVRAMNLRDHAATGPTAPAAPWESSPNLAIGAGHAN